MHAPAWLARLVERDDPPPEAHEEPSAEELELMPLEVLGWALAAQSSRVAYARSRAGLAFVRSIAAAAALLWIAGLITGSAITSLAGPMGPLVVGIALAAPAGLASFLAHRRARELAAEVREREAGLEMVFGEVARRQREEAGAALN